VGLPAKHRHMCWWLTKRKAYDSKVENDNTFSALHLLPRSLLVMNFINLAEFAMLLICDAAWEASCEISTPCFSILSFLEACWPPYATMDKSIDKMWVTCYVPNDIKSKQLICVWHGLYVHCINKEDGITTVPIWIILVDIWSLFQVLLLKINFEGKREVRANPPT